MYNIIVLYNSIVDQELAHGGGGHCRVGHGRGPQCISSPHLACMFVNSEENL